MKKEKEEEKGRWGKIVWRWRRVVEREGERWWRSRWLGRGWKIWAGKVVMKGRENSW